jgi:cytochrome b561
MDAKPPDVAFFSTALPTSPHAYLFMFALHQQSGFEVGLSSPNRNLQRAISNRFDPYTEKSLSRQIMKK